MTLYINSLVVETTGSYLGQLDMNNNVIANVATPLVNQDAANKLYVDTLVAANTAAPATLAQTLLVGNTAGASQIDMNNNAIVNVLTPTASGDAANKGYVDTQLLAETLQTVTTRGATSDQTLTLTNAGTGLIIEGDLVVKGTTYEVNVVSYTETVSSTLFVGDSLTVNGNVTLGDTNADTVTLNGKSYYAEVPTVPTEIANKAYVDSVVSTASGAENLTATLAAGNSAGTYQIDMNNNAIVNVLTPTASGDAANKGYVDSFFTANLQRGSVGGVNFTAGVAAVVFDVAYPNTSYAVTVSTGASRMITVENKTTLGFDLNAHAVTPFLEAVDWVSFGM